MVSGTANSGVLSLTAGLTGMPMVFISAAFASGTNDIVEIGSITAIGPCKKQARGLFYYEQESLALRDPETLK